MRIARFICFCFLPFFLLRWMSWLLPLWPLCIYNTGDTSRTIPVGDVDQAAIDLISASEDALDAAIAVCGPGTPYSAIGNTIHNLVESRGLSVCPYFIGHGIGKHFHCPPAILHYRNTEDYIMQPGHVFTIEPAINEGTSECRILSDGWTAVTVDGKRSAQTEHVILITETVRMSYNVYVLLVISVLNNGGEFFKIWISYD